MPVPPLTPPHKSADGTTQNSAASPVPLKPRPLQPRTPQIASPDLDAEDDAPAHNSTIPAHLRSQRKCPECLYFPMKPLAEFDAKDIERTGTYDTYEPSGIFIFFAPALSLYTMFASAIGNRLFAKAKDAGKRAKVHRAKAEILSRCPNSLICPGCCEVLEIY